MFLRQIHDINTPTSLADHAVRTYRLPTRLVIFLAQEQKNSQPRNTSFPVHAEHRPLLNHLGSQGAYIALSGRPWSPSSAANFRCIVNTRVPHSRPTEQHHRQSLVRTSWSGKFGYAFSGVHRYVRTQEARRLDLKSSGLDVKEVCGHHALTRSVSNRIRQISSWRSCTHSNHPELIFWYRASTNKQ